MGQKVKEKKVKNIAKGINKIDNIIVSQKTSEQQFSFKTVGTKEFVSKIHLDTLHKRTAPRSPPLELPKIHSNPNTFKAVVLP